MSKALCYLGFSFLKPDNKPSQTNKLQVTENGEAVESRFLKIFKGCAPSGPA